MRQQTVTKTAVDILKSSDKGYEDWVRSLKDEQARKLEQTSEDQYYLRQAHQATEQSLDAYWAGGEYL